MTTLIPSNVSRYSLDWERTDFPPELSSHSELSSTGHYLSKPWRPSTSETGRTPASTERHFLEVNHIYTYWLQMYWTLNVAWCCHLVNVTRRWSQRHVTAWCCHLVNVTRQWSKRHVTAWWCHLVNVTRRSQKQVTAFQHVRTTNVVYLTKVNCQLIRANIL